MEKQLPIQIPHKEIAEFCQRNHIHKLSLFGSVLRGDFNPSSDSARCCLPDLCSLMIKLACITCWSRQSKQITAMRNRLVHAYYDVKFDIVWSTVTQDLPPLIQPLEAIIDSEEQDG